MSPQSIACLSITLLCCAPLSEACRAQSYRVVDLGSLDTGDPLPTSVGDIDSSGRVVGRTPGMPNDRAFKWNLGTMIDLGSLDPIYEAGANGLNDRGVAVGWADIASGASHAVAWNGGQIIDLGTLGGLQSEAIAINRSDWIVGWAHDPAQAQHGFLFRNNMMIDIGALPGGAESSATDIDASGRVAGWSRNSSGNYNAIIWENGLMASLGVLPGTRDSFAEAMNDHDQVVGSSDSRAFLFEGDFTGGTMTELPSLGGTRSYAVDINNSGVIVGQAERAGEGLLPCIWLDGVPQSLNELIAPYSGWEITAARTINDAGYIGGEAKLDNRDRGVLLIPTPMHMERPTPGIAGEVNTFVASGAVPGATVRLLYGTQIGYSHPAGCPTAIVEMRQSMLAGTATADQDGVVTLQLFVPPLARGRIFIVQMISSGDCHLGQPLVVAFQ